MCEYWKSVPMWQCPYCKCNIQDTKAARKFHEGGKRHKEAVERYMTQLGVKSYHKQKAQDDVARELRQIEAAALSSYMTHDVNGLLHNVPEKTVVDLPKVEKPSSEMYPTVSTAVSADPEYGTKEYAEWYKAWRSYYTSIGNEKAISMISPPPPPKDDKPQAWTPPPEWTTGNKATSSGQPIPKKKQKAPKPSVTPNASPQSPAEVPKMYSEENFRQELHQEAVAAMLGQNDEDDDELESCAVGQDCQGPAMSSWTTVAVRSLDSASSHVRETGGNGERDDMSDEDEAEDSDRDAFQSLTFNFSRNPDASARSGQTGFRVTTYSAESAPSTAGPKSNSVQLKTVVKEEPGESHTSSLLAQKLVPLSERSKKTIKLEPGIKLEFEDDAILPAGVKRKESTSFAMRSKRQFRRKAEDDKD